jgi:hypothetical protein
MDPDEQKRIREEFLGIMADVEASPEQPLPRRKRGRPLGSKNKTGPNPQDYAPYHSDSSEPLPTLASPPLTSRDQKEVAKRLAGILEGITGVAGVAKPYFKMTPEEAESIATPFSTYIIRQEQFGSAAAKQILEEYDLAAFTIALAAYVVRVYLDFRKEREATKNDATTENRGPRPVGPNDLPITRTVGETLEQHPLQSQEQSERPVSRALASVSQGQRITPDL